MSSERRKRAERKPPEVRAVEIRDAACAIARESGLNSVTLRAVAARIGVAPALVAHYEPSMEALLAASFTQIVQSELADVSGGIPAHHPTQALRELISTLLEPGREETTAVWLDAWSLGRRVGVISDAVRQQMDAWQDFVREIVQAGLASGEFVTDEPDTVAWQLVGMIDGLNAQALVHYRDASSRSRLIVRAMELALGLPVGALA
jgi:AcrR family transcriptional regulator